MWLRRETPHFAGLRIDSPRALTYIDASPTIWKISLLKSDESMYIQPRRRTTNLKCHLLRKSARRGDCEKPSKTLSAASRGLYGSYSISIKFRNHVIFAIIIIDRGSRRSWRTLREIAASKKKSTEEESETPSASNLTCIYCSWQENKYVRLFLSMNVNYLRNDFFLMSEIWSNIISVLSFFFQ